MKLFEATPTTPIKLPPSTIQEELRLLSTSTKEPIKTVLADPPWRFNHRSGKVSPEHHRLSRYPTMGIDEICALEVSPLTAEKAHLYLWVPNALIPDGLKVMEAWGFTYKSIITWCKVRKDGQPDGRGMGFYFRNTTEQLLFGIKGKNNRTGKGGRSQVNVIVSRKEEHSRKPSEQYDIIERCSFAPYLELFARENSDNRFGWILAGNEKDTYDIKWDSYSHTSQSLKHQ